MVTTASSDPVTSQSSSLSGTIHGGQQPVIGATVTLWAAGNAGYGSAATQLATTTSGAAGAFSFGPGSGNTYTCPSSSSKTASQQIYITSTGGASSPGYTNNSAALMVALGDCVAAQSANQNVTVNEITTVASIFALQQFFAPSSNGLGNIGTSATNITGMRNAFATVNNLVNPTNGLSYTSVNLSGTVSGYATAPTVVATPEYAKINTIANVLAACINSTASTSSNCTTLLADVTSGGAKDTLQAAYYMAVNPTSQVGTTNNLQTIYNLASGMAPFGPALTKAPTDWTIGVTYGSTASQTVNAGTTYFLTNPKYIALDSMGNVWIVNNSGAATGSSVSELSPTGVPEAQVLTGSTTAGTLVVPSGIAVDPNNNLFVSNYGVAGAGTTVVEYTSLGTTKTFTTAKVGPQTLASDGAGNIFVATAGAAAGSGDIEAIPAGATTGATPVVQASNVSVGANSALAIDENFNLWLSNASNTAVTQFLCVSTPCKATTTTLPPNPDSIAVDHAGDIWVGNISGSVTELAATANSTITESANSPFTGGGLSGPFTGYIDGNGNIWESDFVTNGGAVTELSGTGKAISPSTGFTHTFNGATGLAIDLSGNLWIGNSTATASGTTAGYVTEIIGQAAPVITPLSAALPGVAGGANTLGTEP